MNRKSAESRSTRVLKVLFQGRIFAAFWLFSRLYLKGWPFKKS